MPSTLQSADFLLKKFLGKGYTETLEQSPTQPSSLLSDGSAYFNEPFDGRTAVYAHSQIWAESHLIPNTPPSNMQDGDQQGVVERILDHQLTQVEGTNAAFHDSRLVDTIAFNFYKDSNGAYPYQYEIKDGSGNPIFLGVQDWILDPDTGILVFNDSLGSVLSSLSTSPPKVSCYKYIGTKGIVSGSGSGSGAAELGNFNRKITLTADGTSTSFNLSNSSKISDIEVTLGGVQQIRGDNYILKNFSGDQINVYQNNDISESQTANFTDTPYTLEFFDPPFSDTNIKVLYYQV